VKAQRPYLLKALYEWICDSGDVPYVLVDAQVEGVVVPREHVKDGQIVLNLGPQAVSDLAMEYAYVMCCGRFSGKAMELVLPMTAILAIYGRDSSQGMVFPEEEALEGEMLRSDAPRDAHSAQQKSKAGDAKAKPALRLV